VTSASNVHGLLQYVHLEKLYGHLPGLVESLPGIFALSPEAYTSARAELDARARAAAEDLLGDAQIERQVGLLPLRSGERILALGDSITDDLMSWAEVLRHLLQLARPGDGMELINGGLSAHTSAMVLRRWPATLAAVRPDRVICCLGGNDVTRVGAQAAKPQVSLAETMANFSELRRIAASSPVASWTWLTPVPVIEERVRAFPGFRYGAATWHNADIVALAAAMRRGLADPVVDLVAGFGVPAKDDLQGVDGVHPTLAGQQVILRSLLEKLAGAR
jgi:acyl-CoA thioesterase I